MKVICDFSQVVYTDTATAATLIKRLADARPKNNKLIFCNVPDTLKKIIDITRVSSFISNQVDRTRSNCGTA